MSKATTFNATVWEQRWKAVTMTMDRLYATMPDNPGTARQKTLKHVLTALQAFGEHQVNFFLDGFGRGGKAFLEPSMLYPPDYVLSVTLDQIMHDLNVIGRAWEQRQGMSDFDIMPKKLAEADQLANKALTPAIDHHLLDPAIVITYFQKNTNVRIIPYAPVSFVGLSLTCQTTPRDLLAIPHEVGHYVYRYGHLYKGQQGKIRLAPLLTQRYSGQSTWRAAWMEEIFADVYGALVGGPVMALGFKDLLSASPREEFFHDDGEHPVAALRLGIYQTVFEAMKVDGAVLDTLKAEREALLAGYGKTTSFITADGNEVDLADAQEELNQLVHSLLTRELVDFRPTPLWSGKVAGEDLSAALHSQFEMAQFAPAPESVIPLAELQLIDTDVLALEAAPGQWNGKSSKRKVGAAEPWIDLIKSAVDGQPLSLPPNVWMALFDGSGWATEGPGANTH